MGEAVTMFPPIVARLRICREPKTRSMSFSTGNSSPSLFSIVVSVAAPPIRHSSFVLSTLSNSGIASTEISVENFSKRFVMSKPSSVAPAMSRAVGCASMSRNSSGNEAGPEKLLRVRFVLHRSEFLAGLGKARGKGVSGFGGKRFHRRIANRPVARAAAKIPAELIVELVGRAEVIAIVALEQRHDESRRAIAALRAVALDHLLLHRMQSGTARHAFDGDHFAPRQQADGNQTTVDRAIGSLALGRRSRPSRPSTRRSRLPRNLPSCPCARSRAGIPATWCWERRLPPGLSVR